MTITVFIRYQIDPFQARGIRGVCTALAFDHPDLRWQGRRLLHAARGRTNWRSG
jgi:hypothetical protein